MTLCKTTSATDSTSRAAPTLTATQTSAPPVTLTAIPPTLTFAPVVIPAAIRYGFTYQQQDGNRLVMGRGTMPTATVLDVPLDDVPVGLVTAQADGALWVVALANGAVRAFRLRANHVEALTINPNSLPADIPPLLTVVDGKPTLVVAADPDRSPLTHPLPAADQLLLIRRNGDGALEGPPDAPLPLAALPDARIVSNGNGRYAVYAGGTSERCRHVVLGDGIEATRLAIFEVAPSLRVVQSIQLPPPDVFEGIAAIWADVDGDGTRELLVTVSSASNGGRLVV